MKAEFFLTGFVTLNVKIFSIWLRFLSLNQGRGGSKTLEEKLTEVLLLNQIARLGHISLLFWLIMSEMRSA